MRYLIVKILIIKLQYPSDSLLKTLISISSELRTNHNYARRVFFELITTISSLYFNIRILKECKNKRKIISQ